jgi:hypothetical protein
MHPILWFLIFNYKYVGVYNSLEKNKNTFYPFKDEAQTALFKDPVRTAQ